MLSGWETAATIDRATMMVDDSAASGSAILQAVELLRVVWGAWLIYSDSALSARSRRLGANRVW